MHTANPSKKLDMGKGCVGFKSLDEELTAIFVTILKRAKTY